MIAGRRRRGREVSGQSARPPQPSAGPVPMIADRYSVLASAPRGEIGGVSACKAEDRRGLSGELLALKVMRDAPCRPRLPVYIDLRHEGLLAPLASGFIGNDYWIIAPAPGGRPMTSLVTPWIGQRPADTFPASGGGRPRAVARRRPDAPRDQAGQRLPVGGRWCRARAVLGSTGGDAPATGLRAPREPGLRAECARPGNRRR